MHNDNYYENREANNIIINMNNEIKNLINIIFGVLSDLGIKTDSYLLNNYLNKVTTIKPNRPYYAFNKTIILEICRILKTDLSYPLNFIRYNKSLWNMDSQENIVLLYNAIISFYEEFTGCDITDNGVFYILKENTDILDNAFYNFSYALMREYKIDYFINTGYELFEFEGISAGIVAMYYLGDYRIKYYNENVKKRRN